MRIFSISLAVSVVLLAAGCSAGTTSGQDPVPKELVGRAALYMAKVQIPENVVWSDAVWSDVVKSLKAAGVPEADIGKDVHLEGGWVPGNARSLLVVKDKDGSTVRWIRQSNDVATSSLVVCVQGEGATAVAVDLNLGDTCKE